MDSVLSFFYGSTKCEEAEVEEVEEVEEEEEAADGRWSLVSIFFFLFVFACPLSATTVHGFIAPPSRACQTIQILVLVVGGFKAVLDGTLSRRCRENNAFMCLNFILFYFIFRCLVVLPCDSGMCG